MNSLPAHRPASSAPLHVGVKSKYIHAHLVKLGVCPLHVGVKILFRSIMFAMVLSAPCTQG